MNQNPTAFGNPFRPGAGHVPPYLAGRTSEQDEFRRLLRQKIILENLVLTGLRGVGKTVLLETFKPIAQQNGWLWVGTDLSESASVSEERLATRLLADIAPLASGIEIGAQTKKSIGFHGTEKTIKQYIDYNFLRHVYESVWFGI